MPPTLGRPPCRLCEMLFYHWPIRGGGPSRRSMPRAGINMDCTVGDRLEPVFSIFDFNHRIRSGLQR